MAVCVLDRHSKALMPCSEKRARLLLERGRARVHRLMPFVIRLIDREVEECEFQPLRLKCDPGSRTTGMALVRIQEDGGTVVLHLFELKHRGRAISEALTGRRAKRRRRRNANLRYRAPRFLNRRRPPGWLAPSLQHRVDTTMVWVHRLQQWVLLTGISIELVRFDTQALDNPAIEGAEYQQGTLQGYEVREYLLEKWGRKCAYCDGAGMPLQIEHIHPKSQGGSHRISNLTLACAGCNLNKGPQDIRLFLAPHPQRLARILAQAKAPLQDAAAVNSTRWALFKALKGTGLPVETASGGRTKWNRSRFGIPKTHALDAVCVGSVAKVSLWQRPTLAIKATGRGAYQRTRLSGHGFPRGYLMGQKQVQGFQTGDRVRAIVLKGQRAGTYLGRVAVRRSGSFNIQTDSGVVQGISYKYCQLLQRNDGYGYGQHHDFKKGEAGRGQAAPDALSLPGMNAEVSRAI